MTYSTQYPLSAIDDFNCIGDGSTPDGDNMATAISTAISLGRDLYIPAGTYKMQTTGPPPALKLLTADVSATTFGAIRIFGDGVDSTILQWFDDIGSGDYAFNITHADQTHFLIVEDLSLLGKNLNTDPNDDTQTSPSAGYGLRIANRTIVRNVLSRGFYAGFAINGELVDDDTTAHTDHFDTYGLRAQQNFYGVYIKDNVNLTRDWLFENARISINQRAGIACADSGQIRDTTFIDTHFKDNPYAFFKEGTTIQPTFMDIVTFVRTKCETSGNWAIFGKSDGGTIDKIKGDLEIHQIQVDSGHTYCPTVIASLVRDATGSDTSCTLGTSTSHGLAVGDHFAITGFVITSPFDETSLNGAFIVTTVVDTTHIKYKQVGTPGFASNPGGHTDGRLGDIGAIRCGVFQQSYPTLSIIHSTSTPDTEPELFWSVSQIDTTKISILDGVLPSIRVRNSSQHGQNQSVEFTLGDVYAYLARAAGDFPAGYQLEGASTGDVVLSAGSVIASPPVPHAGTSLQPGGTSESVMNNVVTRRWAWVQASGRNSTAGAGQVGVGLHYTTDPGDNAVLMEDPNHAGDVAAWDKSTTARRIVGRSIAPGSGNFIEAHLHPAFIART